MVAEPSQIGLVPNTGLQVAPAGGMGQIHVRLLLRGLAEQANTRKQLLHSSPVGDYFQISTVRYCASCRSDTDTSCSPWAIRRPKTAVSMELKPEVSEHLQEGLWSPILYYLTNEAFRVQWGVTLSPWSTYLLVRSSPKNNFCKVINTFFMIFQVTAFNLMGDCMYVCLRPHCSWRLGWKNAKHWFLLVDEVWAGVGQGSTMRLRSVNQGKG